MDHGAHANVNQDAFISSALPEQARATLVNDTKNRPQRQRPKTDPEGSQKDLNDLNAHFGFQKWLGVDIWDQAVDHVRRESFDPGSGSHLDKATAWFWCFFRPDESPPLRGPGT